MITRDRRGQGKEAFTRTELITSLGAVMVLFLWVLPLLANNKTQSELMGCFNNLRRIGQASQQWAADHHGWMPWRTPWGYGGTLPDGSIGSPSGTKPGLAWIEMVNFSNHLASPKYLVCPSDKTKRVAGSWLLADYEQGFLHPNFRNNALSYFVGMETIPWWPRGIVSGDRNLRYDFFGGGCSARVNNAMGMVTPQFPGHGIGNWTNAIHGAVGNLLFTDGSVERHSRETFRNNLRLPDDNGQIHFLAP